MRYLRLLHKVQKCQLYKEHNQKLLNVLRSSLHTCPAPINILTEDEEALRESVEKVAKEQIAPNVKVMEMQSKVTDDVLDAIRSNGLLGMEASTDYGGSGCSFMMTMLAIEELSKVDPAVAALVDIHNTLVVRFMDKIGTKEQKEKYLTKLATDTVGSFCLSEATSGSDAFALKTTAKKEGEHYVINGSKMWISNSDLAEIFLIMANADLEKGYRGITCFIGDRNTPGITIGKQESKLGIRASGTHVIYFDNYKVPAKNILGEFGQGYKYAIHFLNEGRIGIGAQMLGLAEGCFNNTVPYLMERKQFGQPLINFQAIEHQISRMATEIEVAKLMVYNTARLVDSGKPFVKEAAMTKYFCAEMAGKVTSSCVDLMGGVGFTTDFPQEKYFRDAKIGTIYEGTSNMMLNTIIKHVKNEFGN